MIPGLNSNIKHGGKIFHIQTEDSGARYAHVISHLFLDGAILASVKTPYDSLLELEEDEREAQVVLLMRRSHRQLIQSLTSGAYNQAAGLGDAVPEPEPEPVVEAETPEAEDADTGAEVLEELPADTPLEEEADEVDEDPYGPDAIHHKLGNQPVPFVASGSLAARVTALLDRAEAALHESAKA